VIVVRVSVDGDAVRLHVIDQGPGMDAETRDRAFERFWRPAGDSDDHTGNGFGLGLAIVAQLAARAGGDVRLLPGPDDIGLDAVVSLRRVPNPSDTPGTDPRAEVEQNVCRTLTSG
jgi:signal transduction histidine kinase